MTENEFLDIFEWYFFDHRRRLKKAIKKYNEQILAVQNKIDLVNKEEYIKYCNESILMGQREINLIDQSIITSMKKFVEQFGGEQE